MALDTSKPATLATLDPNSDMPWLRVLDHGFVRLRNLAGPTRRHQSLHWQQGLPVVGQHFDADDTDPANAARMSFDASDRERTLEMEMKLNRYLLVNQHATPFESIVVWLEMKLPIFVARQFVRHRTQAINEVSARYVQLPEEWYIPGWQSVMMQAENKKQGGRLINIDDQDEISTAKSFCEELDIQCSASYKLYQNSLALGIAPEQARLFLHVNHYTHWMTTMNLRNLFGFLALRCHSHAQREARLYGEAIVDLLRPHLPELMKLFDELVRKPE